MPQADAGAVFLQNALFFCPVLYYNKLEKFRDCPGCTYYKDGVILLHTVLLVFDIGTSGLKASLVDERLNILRNVTTTYPTHYLPGGGVEQDAADWWMSAVRAMLMLRELVPEYLKQVDAIGVSGHMLGLLPMDREGQALRPAIIRRDTRAKAVTETLLDRYGADYFYRISGNVLTPNLTLSKAVWLHENEPEVYEKTVRFLQCKDYLVYRLTGSMDTTDFSDASRAGLMNLQTRDYDYDMLETLSLHAEKFPTIRPGCAIAGHLTEEAAYHLGLRAGIPVSVGGGNGMCESVGAGVVSIGSYYMSLDTAAWIAGQTDTPFFDAQRRLGHICSLDGRSFSVFGAMRCAGKCVNWAQKIFDVGSPRAFDAAASNIPAGADGLVFLPYLEGERSPIYDEQAQGVFFGMTQQHRREHFLRAVLEGVGCGLSQILDVLRERDEISDLHIIGGGAKSRVWKQIISDLCSVRLHDVTTLSDCAATLGAAAAAGVGIGLFESLSQAVSGIAQASVLSPDERNYDAYRALRARYDRLYPALSPVFHM